MNPRLFLVAACLLVLAGLPAPAQESTQPDSLGLPGDNLNLYAVLDAFRQSPTLEEFEKKLNDPEAKINNLDLNGDDRVDYLRVVDSADGDFHAILLRDPVSTTETQDVAVIQVQRDNDGGVHIQAIGDEDLYGKDYIVEPRYTEGGTPNPGYEGTETVTTPEETAHWPIVRVIYLPGYDPWYSPWYFGYYPPWWNPWEPFYWHYYWGFHYHQFAFYHSHYHFWPHYRSPWFRTRYFGAVRSRSAMVAERRRSGFYHRTYGRPELRREGMATYRKTHPRDVRPGSERPSSVRPGARPGRTERPSKPGMKRPTSPRPDGRPEGGSVSRPPRSSRPESGRPQGGSVSSPPRTSRPEGGRSPAPSRPPRSSGGGGGRHR
jgi:hypothetical protein